jgi:tRNA pseudouridine38-40 synthase
MYVFRIAFRGSGYHGWQYQENAESVQGVLKKVLSEIFKGDVPFPAGCSRTDTGVHALEFVATFPQIHKIPPDSLQKGMNSLLPDDIRVIGVEERDGFVDGRALVAGKHYRYLICLKNVASPFASDLCWHSVYDLDIAAMHKAVNYFIGTHDFSGFMSTGSEVATTVRTIRKAEITVKGDYLFIDFAGDGFLKHQVRIMSGTLVAVGRKKLQPDDVPVLMKSCDRSLVPHTLPGKGLYLHKLFKSVEEMEKYEFPQTFQGMTW